MIVVRLCAVFHLVPHSTIPFDCGYREVDDYLKWQDISCMRPDKPMLTPRHQHIKSVWVVRRIDRGAGFLCLSFLSVVWPNHQRLHRSQEEIPRGSRSQAVQPQILAPRDSSRRGNGGEHERDPPGDDVLPSVLDGHDLSRFGVRFEADDHG